MFSQEASIHRCKVSDFFLALFKIENYICFIIIDSKLIQLQDHGHALNKVIFNIIQDVLDLNRYFLVT